MGHLSCDNATATFTTQKTANLSMSRLDIKTRCAFYRVPNLSSRHWTSWQMQTFYEYATRFAVFIPTTILHTTYASSSVTSERHKDKNTSLCIV